MSFRKKVKSETNFLRRVFLLLGFKEAYFFSKNLFGMLVHPQLTTAKILKKGDLSQAFLVFGLPFNLWLVLLFFSFAGWYFLRPTGWFFIFGLTFFLLVGYFLFWLAVYSLYWVLKYLRKVNRI